MVPLCVGSQRRRLADARVHSGKWGQANALGQYDAQSKFRNEFLSANLSLCSLGAEGCGNRSELAPGEREDGPDVDGRPADAERAGISCADVGRDSYGLNAPGGAFDGAPFQRFAF